MRPINLRTQLKIRELDPCFIDKLISLKGIVIRNSDVIPEMKEAYFKCCKCGNQEQVYVEKYRIIEPDFCENCKSKGTYQMIHNRCVFGDRQHIKLQETPESVPEGQTPHTIALNVHDDLVDSIRPGDRVEVTGIFRAQPVRVNPLRRTLKNVFRTYIDAITFIKSDKRRFNEDNENKEDEVEDQALNQENKNELLFTPQQE